MGRKQSIFDANGNFAARADDDIMVQFVFGNYQKVADLAQTEDVALEVKAREIAERLGLAYEYRFQGYGDLASFMRSVPPDASRSPAPIYMARR